MGCIDSKPAVRKPVVPLRGVSEQHIDLHLASKQQNKRNNVFTAGAADVSHVDLKAKNFPKTRDQEKIIRACIESPEAFFFQGISEEEKQLLFNAMQATTVQAGHPIIVQGDHGDNFYIVESGTFYATLGGKRIKDYGRGMFFGELALAYNKPRAATVKAETAGSVFSLDRETFRFILQNSATNKVKEVKAPKAPKASKEPKAADKERGRPKKDDKVVEIDTQQDLFATLMKEAVTEHATALKNTEPSSSTSEKTVAATTVDNDKELEMEEEDEEESVSVSKFEFNGKEYLMTKCSQKILYDPKTQDVVGKWNEVDKCIDSYREEEEDA